ncbi:MAG: DNA polymerase/3'-5' exonuclease PolX [Candidatus Latescibacteria bacterium]|nr:DNA polymerase/3'-5' exonuclease PolX [Candidatus Latescibacterota bacterium]
MPDTSNRAIADFIEEYSILLELSGANPFRIRSYANAVRTFELLDREAADLVAEGTLTKVKGVGKSVAELVVEYLQTGTALAYEELKGEVPSGLLDMLRIQGLGPKKIRALHEQKQISDLDALEAACRDGSIAEVSGFGAKTQANILKGIEYVRQYQGLFLVDTATELAAELEAHLKAHPAVSQLQRAGSLRRCKEVVKDIDLVAATDQPQIVSQAFATHPRVVDILSQGDTKTTVQLDNGMQADLRLVGTDTFAATLHHFTGSKEHNIQLRARAQAQGMHLNEYGLQRDGQAVDCSSEEALFAALGLAYIPPELREGAGEVEAAEAADLPQLVRPEDIRGMLHVHSNYSDGADTLEEMAQAVKERGYSYLGMCDHSQAAAYAGGLKEDDVRRQHEEIERLNERLDDFHIFKGIESDILTDGSLDYPDAVLETFDFIVVSVHSQFTMSQADMTARIIRAIEHPASTIVGHLTGRLLLDRDGYAVDVDAVVDAAARCNTAIEINANPHRLDIDWRHVRRARDLGIKLPINTDAHRIGGLDDIGFGIGIARKGWLRPQDVLNTLETDALAAYFAGAR